MGKNLLLWEALKAITENPRLKLKNDAGELGFQDGRLRWIQSNQDFTIQHGKTGMWDTLTKRYFSIIEPPKRLKKMSFGEAFGLFYKDVCHEDCDHVKSVGTEFTLENPWSLITKEAYNGLWTVEGVFEEVETNG
jgi:hypothetical protein